MVSLFDNAVTQPNDDNLAFAAGYRPLPGIFDEMMDADGRIRRHWLPLLSMLSGLGADGVDRAFAAADRYLRDSGVFYRVYEDPTGVERPWPLSHVPLLIDPTEWKQLEAGLIQRATLLEAVLADTYGPGHLIRDGRLPAALVAGNPEYLRPLAGVKPPGGAHLGFYAVDVGRGADGKWWVLSDRAQAPSGAGYAIENRLALSRAIPDIYRSAHVERLAPFFQAFQSALSAFNRQDDTRVCLLTPGPMNETYFEHAYLARYLGLLLVEGEDLTVRDDGVFIRTVSGLRRTEVLLRRLDADFSDPLELNGASRLGIAGLVQAVRDDKVAIVNSLGAGLVEARAMLAFLPALAMRVLGQDLAIPNIATWWLGRPDVRAEIAARFENMVIAPAFTEAANIQLGNGVLVSSLDAAERQNLARSIENRGVDFVVQEAVTLSTTPVWRDGKLQPRPFTLRLFLAKLGDRWAMMPGGFVRTTDSADARAVSLQHGGAAADAWVLSDGPILDASLLPAPDRIVIQRTTGALPSRAADNLFWVGRYVERAEATLRLIRALLARDADGENAHAPAIASISKLLGIWGALPADGSLPPAINVARRALTDSALDGSLPHLVRAARAAGSAIRDRFSPDVWRALNDLVTLIDAPLTIGPAESEMVERVESAIRIISAFSGMAQENMTRLAGWRFLELGRRIERAILTSRCVRWFPYADARDDGLDVLLEFADSQITYRQRYVMIAAQAPVIDLVLLDPNNPRSVAFQLDRIEAHLAELPRRHAADGLSPVQQIATTLAARLRTAEAIHVDYDLIVSVEDALMKLSEAIASYYLTHNERSENAWGALA